MKLHHESASSFHFSRGGIQWSGTYFCTLYVQKTSYCIAHATYTHTTLTGTHIHTHPHSHTHTHTYTHTLYTGTTHTHTTYTASIDNKSNCTTNPLHLFTSPKGASSEVGPIFVLSMPKELLIVLCIRPTHRPHIHAHIFTHTHTYTQTLHRHYTHKHTYTYTHTHTLYIATTHTHTHAHTNT